MSEGCASTRHRDGRPSHALALGVVGVAKGVALLGVCSGIARTTDSPGEGSLFTPTSSVLPTLKTNHKTGQDSAATPASGGAGFDSAFVLRGRRSALGSAFIPEACCC